ncbi:hypothetical protein ACOT81_14380 [Streptomyces sp. WI04-05B]|uniref:hypothetical protein n=1 Tax=Streptomyces TaxID=1883 RepID=UPI0029A85DE1|nr:MULTISPECIES: hypothetical protein [unclassified Streptomyces]MDX2540429.1 hypothetical protein [Streptomyces sp. WI04-05B]MDX2585138.1 hypothetical protein [Streptomyces sp. WI04-05A]MDX3749408.1 hypothetical protein [Streptomyces sp. AK08-02]
MTTPSVKAQMPKSVRQALVGVWIQGVLNLVAGFLLVALADDAADHGRGEGTGLVRSLAVLTLVIAGALLLCGVFAGRRLNGVRVTVIVIEALGLLIGVVGLFQGGFSVLPGILLAVLVLRGFSTAEARNWFDR